MLRSAPTLTATDHAAARDNAWPAMFAILLGSAFTLCLRGYQFGQSNHTVYLLDALRRVHPELLANDWFTTGTLQYHALFGVVTAWLMRLEWLEAGFLVGYLALVVALHVAWDRLVRTLGGSTVTYLLSVLLYHLSAGGTGLGMYQFLQDGSFLPSNVANVALLWGIWLWCAGRFPWAGAAVGVAGLFHLNHALVGIGLWVGLLGWDAWRARKMAVDRARVVGTLLAIVPPAINILFALRVTADRTGRMPLAEFVDLYAKLRHPHHYDPSSWPLALWVSFLWPVPLAILAVRRTRPLDASRTQAVRIALLLSALLLVALLGAGVWYVSEPLVQMSLWRFSIYPKLLTCVAAAWLIYDAQLVNRRTLHAALLALPVLLAGGLIVARVMPMTSGFATQQAVPLAIFVLLCGMVAAFAVVRQRHWAPYAVASVLLVGLLTVSWDRWLGLSLIPKDDPAYLAAADWAREHTPIDAVFLVPPDEFSFRLRAQRAIVINFKGVPQLSGEMPVWRDRLQRVLDLPDLRALPRPFPRTTAAIRDHYDALPGEHLSAVAHAHGARYVLTARRLDGKFDPLIVYAQTPERYYLYDLNRSSDAR